jgi:hypothetical protein
MVQPKTEVMMSSTKTKNQKPTYSNFTINGVALALLLGFCLSIYVGQSLFQNQVFDLFFERGALPYIILFLILRSTTVYYAAKYEEQLDTSFHQQFLATAFYPVLLGLIGLWWGMSHAMVGYSPYYAQSSELITLTEYFRNFCIGESDAVEPFVLGVLGSLTSLGMAFRLRKWSKPVKQHQPVVMRRQKLSTIHDSKPFYF